MMQLLLNYRLPMISRFFRDSSAASATMAAIALPSLIRFGAHRSKPECGLASKRRTSQLTPQRSPPPATYWVTGDLTVAPTGRLHCSHCGNVKGVTIILTGSASISAAPFILNAPSRGLFAGLVLVQDAGDVAPSHASKITGGPDATLNGLVYFPKIINDLPCELKRYGTKMSGPGGKLAER
jgi:hypothetical protein